MPNAPPPDAVARFHGDVTALTGPFTGQIAIGVSGGADSLALLLLAQAAFPDQVVAATVDHGLRPESRDEALFVRAICDDLGVEHAIGRAAIAPGGNLQARARMSRYDELLGWFEAVGATWLATAHHADDQLETVIMRLNRAAGVGGLAAIRARDDVLIRPLLKWRREELAEVVAECGITPVDDPSNRDDRFDRARLRKALKEVDWLEPLSVVRSAAALAEADQALDWVVETFLGKILAKGENKAVLARSLLLALPRELQRRLVLAALEHVEPAIEVREKTLDQLLEGVAEQARLTVGTLRFVTGTEYVLIDFAPARKG